MKVKSSSSCHMPHASLATNMTNMRYPPLLTLYTVPARLPSSKPGFWGVRSAAHTHAVPSIRRPVTARAGVCIQHGREQLLISNYNTVWARVSWEPRGHMLSFGRTRTKHVCKRNVCWSEFFTRVLDDVKCERVQVLHCCLTIGVNYRSILPSPG